MRSQLFSRRPTQVQVGVLVILLIVIVGAVLFDKQRLKTKLSSGQTVKASFQRDYRLRPYISKVKVAGVMVGVVTNARHMSNGTAEISMKVQNGIKEKIGTAPSAKIRPATLLGGNYYIELIPGGERGTAPHGVIPVSRTTTPVEVDTVLTALRAPQRKAIQGVTKQLDDSLSQGGTRSLHQLTNAAPVPLRKSAVVLRAAEGTHPSSDLQHVVSGLESTAKGLTARQGQLGGSVKNLATVSSTLDKRSASVNLALSRAPSSLKNTTKGLSDLSTTLHALDRTSAVAGPAVTHLGKFLDHAQPALKSLRPVVSSLRPLMFDLRGTTQQLLPAVSSTQSVLDDVSGPVISRVNGPIVHTLVDPYRGKTRFYQALAYTLAGMNSTSMTTDPNGAEIDFQPGPGAGSAEAPRTGSLNSLLQSLSGNRKAAKR
jgi:phospholipid/cholesterol/gamma-HCH transport system substrate-binding protein